ncbi:ATP-binding cassette domain-containing protein [Cytobacillus sp. FJAT-54145]|uniref:ABC transporter ATP-binding protein n=1 Tax=Cytobacillus spartinae TaxID=3299023 RepID=A0ABW6K7J0_9BACI
MMNAVEFKEVTYLYPNGMKALNHINLQIPIGTKVALLGPNGAGKSTLLHHLNGLKVPQQGTVKIMGEELTKKNANSIRQKVGLVFQDPDDQVFSGTVLEDVEFGPRNLKMTEEEISEVCLAALGNVGMLDYKDQAPYHLSYGQKKRVAIAGILAMKPDVVILDEPMSYLDPAGQDDIAGLLQGLNFLGKTIILSTHDVNFAASWADMIVIIMNGEIIATGGTELLVDEEVIRKAKLHLPIVSRLFKMLPNVDTLPKNEQEAFRLLYRIIYEEEGRFTY